MTIAMPRRRILVGVTDSPASLQASRWGADEAVRLGLSLELLHVQAWPPHLPTDPGPEHPHHAWATRYRATGQEVLDRIRASVWDRHPELEVATVLAEGRVSRRLQEATEYAAQLVIGCRRLTDTELLTSFRSKALTLVGHTPCPLALVPAPEAGTPADGPVVVGVDGSTHANRAIGEAFAIAAAREAELIAVEVRRNRQARWPEFPEQSELDLAEAVAGWRQKFPDVEVRYETLLGEPALVLAAASRRAACLVVGARGRGGVRGMMAGSTSRSLVHRTGCPLLVIPADRPS